MRLTKRQLLKVIYEQQVQDSKTPAEVTPEEDVWARGEGSLEEPIDHEEAEGLPSNVQEPEVLDIKTQEIVERLKRRMRLKKLVREQLEAAAEEEVVEDVPPAPPGPAEEERASASQQSLKDWLRGKSTEVITLGIADQQVPSLIAAMEDLILSAQSGALKGREAKVRTNIGV